MIFNLAIANNVCGDWEFSSSLRDRVSKLFADSLIVLHKSLTPLALKQLTDDQCIKRMAVGEEEPFQVLFERYGDLVFGYCVKLLKDRERAEDASQDVWVKVIRNAKKYKSQGKFRAWLLQIARNTCFSLFRDIKKNRAEDVDDHEVEDVTQESILDLMSAEENRERVKKCIEALPDNQRMALVVWMTEDKSYEEIAEQMETSVSAVKSLLFRGRQSLKDMLGEAHG